MSKCFIDKQYIRHKMNGNTMMGIYNKDKNKIIYNNKYYSLNQFALTHLNERSKRENVNAWSECECLINNEWVSTFNL